MHSEPGVLFLLRPGGSASREAAMICAGNLRDRKPMTQDSVIVPVEAARVLPIVQRGFGASLLAVYLHGSAVAGGLRPDSDVDILVVVDRPAAPAVRGDLIAE